MRRVFAERIVVCDGAMGTMLHSTGVPLDRALCELNVTQPRLVRDLHAAYIAAGAEMIQTNTFDANRMRLSRVGLDDSVVEINIAGARLAREAAESAGRPALVAGSVGPAINATAVPRLPGEAREATLREQITALADWVDLLILETFGDIESLVQGVEIALQETDAPVVAQLTFGDDGRTLGGDEPAEVAAVLGAFDLAAVGANCTVGPAVLLDVVAELAAAAPLPVSVQPNAGLPRRFGRQVRYVHNTAYFAEAARRFVASGANIVGGCCGTTPAHVRAVAKAVDGSTPTRSVPVESGSGSRAMRPQPVASGTVRNAVRNAVSWPFADRFAVIASLPANRGQEVDGLVEHARELGAAGAVAIAVTDPPPPAARMNPIAIGIVLHERVAAEVVLPVETADRSLAALQADLLGAHALGLRTVICRTGSPRVAGDYPDPGSLWDVDSVRLIATLASLNEGTDWRGVATPDRTGFVIGAAVDTSAVEPDRELDRVEEKVRAGAHFLVTDTILDAERAQRMLAGLRMRGVDVPVVASVAPFLDVRTAQRMRNERPGADYSTTVLSVVRDEADPRHAVEVVEKLRAVISGVLVHLPAADDARASNLVRRLVNMGEA